MEARRSVSDFKQPEVNLEAKERDIRLNDRISELERQDLLQELANDRERAQIIQQPDDQAGKKSTNFREDNSNQELLALQQEQIKKDAIQAEKAPKPSITGPHESNLTSLGSEYSTPPTGGLQSVKRDPKKARQAKKPEEQKEWEADNLIFHWSSEETD
ncbi:MAG: hypothetical protein M1831_003910 [Alyxoria varia]|nr:MAG: hypothetical protein M1831_003910 [Alyxoria varia]